MNGPALHSLAGELCKDVNRARKALLLALANAEPVLAHDGQHIEPLVELARVLTDLDVGISELKHRIAAEPTALARIDRTGSLKGRGK